LLPVIDADLDHVKRLEQILASQPSDSDISFKEALSDGIGLLTKAYQIRLEAAQELRNDKNRGLKIHK